MEVRLYQRLGSPTGVYLGKEETVNRFLVMALGVASTSKCRQMHGCVVVRHGRVLGVGVNVTKNSPRYVNWRYSSVHAEINAMRKAGWPRKATVYVARINSLGESKLSKPCSSCQIVLDSYKAKVIWT